MNKPGPEGIEQDGNTRWNPGLYQKFGDQRLRPGLELMDRINCVAPGLVYDLGCGGGQLTRAIAARWPAAQVIGVDHSKEMLAQAASKSGPVQWLEADLREWRPQAPPDLIYSNATLQWIEGHHEFLPRLAAMLNVGGTLAVQMPLSWGLPSHRLMRAVLDEGDADGSGPLGRKELRCSVARKWVEEAETYYNLLAGRCKHIDIWETEYLQILTGEDPVLEWVKGTGLRPVLNGLDGAQRKIFLKAYSRRLRQAYPSRGDGATLYPFRRLFIVATV
jgi:trans-aconitate 2-methyltransferase